MKTHAALAFRAVLSFFVLCVALVAGLGWALAETAGPASNGTVEILSVSWQPGYCVARPKSGGCKDFQAPAPAERQFTLHSRFLARKSYCGIEAGLKQQARKGKWTDLPEITLASGTKERLLAAMPAVRLGLDRQQWLRSGSCIAPSAEAYYSRSLDLLDQLNGSAVRALFAAKAGSAVTLAEVRAAFDQAFGAGAGERVRLACRKAGDKTVVTGMTVGMGSGEGTLQTLIATAPPTKSRCTEGITGQPG